VLAQEADSHLLGAALESDDRQRLQQLGAYRLLVGKLDGSLLERYKLMAAQKMALEDEPAGMPSGGSDYMDSDGLEE
jgi:hypothetical protein